MMTSRERVLTALECKQPDRVPFLELSVDEEFGNRYLGIPSPQKSQGLGPGDEPVIVQSLFGGADYDALTMADALNLASLKKRYGNRICFCGHIDMDELGQGTPQKIDQLVKQAIRDAGSSEGLK